MSAAGKVVMPARTYNQNCPVALGLDILGERWTLLILRELVGGPRRYGDLRAELPGIATNLLAERLKEPAGFGLDRSHRLAGPDRAHRLYPQRQGLAAGAARSADRRLGGPGPVGPDREWSDNAVERLPGRRTAGLQPGERRRRGGDLPCRDRRPPFRLRRNSRPSRRRARRTFGDDHRQRGDLVAARLGSTEAKRKAALRRIKFEGDLDAVEAVRQAFAL